MAAINYGCKGCNKRYPGCHDHCETYQSTKAENERIKDLHKADIEYRNYSLDGRANRLSNEAVQKKNRCGRTMFRCHS